MMLNSILGPLNCSEYDSGLVSTDANAPAAGMETGLIHASSETVDANDSDADDVTPTLWFDPEHVTALSPSPVNKLAAPSVGAPLYTPGFDPTESAAFVPDTSFSR